MSRTAFAEFIDKPALSIRDAEGEALSKWWVNELRSQRKVSLDRVRNLTEIGVEAAQWISLEGPNEKLEQELRRVLDAVQRDYHAQAAIISRLERSEEPIFDILPHMRAGQRRYYSKLVEETRVARRRYLGSLKEVVILFRSLLRAHGYTEEFPDDPSELLPPDPWPPSIEQD